MLTQTLGMVTLTRRMVTLTLGMLPQMSGMVFQTLRMVTPAGGASTRRIRLAVYGESVAVLWRPVTPS